MEIKPVKNYKKPLYMTAAAVAAGVMSGCTTQLGGAAETVSEIETAVRPITQGAMYEGTVINTTEAAPDTDISGPSSDGDAPVTTELILTTTEREAMLTGTAPVVGETEDMLVLEGEAPFYPDAASINENVIFNMFAEKNSYMYPITDSVNIGEESIPVSFIDDENRILITFSCDLSDSAAQLFESRAESGTAEKTGFGCIDTAEYSGEEYTVVCVSCGCDEELSEEQVSEIIKALEERGII